MSSKQAKQPPQKEPEFIRLMDAQRSTVLDSVATEYEDSFCLESFADLIKSAAEAEGGGYRGLTAVDSSFHPMLLVGYLIHAHPPTNPLTY